jgi:hypothetical protein
VGHRHPAIGLLLWWTGLYCNPPLYTFPPIWDDSCLPLCPAIDWDGGLVNSLPWLASNHDPPHLCLLDS